MAIAELSEIEIIKQKMRARFLFYNARFYIFFCRSPQCLESCIMTKIKGETAVINSLLRVQIENMALGLVIEDLVRLFFFLII